MERRFKPQVPAVAKVTAIMDYYEWISQHALMEISRSVLDRPLRIFSAKPKFFAISPLS